MDLLLTTNSDNWADCSELVQNTVQTAVDYVKLPLLHDDIYLSIVLSDDDQMRELNAEYRGKDKPTNVLSFPMEDFSRGISELCIKKGGQPLLLGDIVLSLTTIQKEAGEQNKKFEDHLSHLIVHGVLHLLGYDHLNDQDAKNMEQIEANILANIGVKNPYE